MLPKYIVYLIIVTTEMEKPKNGRILEYQRHVKNNRGVRRERGRMTYSYRLKNGVKGELK